MFITIGFGLLMALAAVHYLDAFVTLAWRRVGRTKHSTQPLRDALAIYDASAAGWALAARNSGDYEAWSAANTAKAAALRAVQAALHEIAPDLHNEAHARALTLEELRRIAALSKY